jgi:predicted SnoaL-like aldol condensation-catalyzing enzyme
MKRLALCLLTILCIGCAGLVFAQVRVEASPNQELLLASPNAGLAANKRLVYDFWREVLEAGHLDLADRYLAEGYIQHNPNVPTGRAGFVEFFSKFVKPTPIQPHVQAPLIAMLAEGNLVVMSFVREAPDPQHPGSTYTTTAFDMFRVENGRIAEHWDAASKH